MRYKHVYKNDELFHMWAHGQLAERGPDNNNARNASGLVGFRGDFLYSYERPVARLDRHHMVALFAQEYVPYDHAVASQYDWNDPRRRYRAYTKHNKAARAALGDDWLVIRVDDPRDTFESDAIQRQTQGRIDSYLAQALEETARREVYIALCGELV